MEEDEDEVPTHAFLAPQPVPPCLLLPHEIPKVRSEKRVEEEQDSLVESKSSVPSLSLEAIYASSSIKRRIKKDWTRHLTRSDVNRSNDTIYQVTRELHDYWPPGYVAEDEAALSKYRGPQEPVLASPSVHKVLGEVFGTPHRRRPRDVPDRFFGSREPLMFVAHRDFTGGNCGTRANNIIASSSSSSEPSSPYIVLDNSNEQGINAARKLLHHLEEASQKKSSWVHNTSSKHYSPTESSPSTNSSSSWHHIQLVLQVAAAGLAAPPSGNQSDGGETPLMEPIRENPGLKLMQTSLAASRAALEQEYSRSRHEGLPTRDRFLVEPLLQSGLLQAVENTCESSLDSIEDTSSTDTLSADERVARRRALKLRLHKQRQVIVQQRLCVLGARQKAYDWLSVVVAAFRQHQDVHQVQCRLWLKERAKKWGGLAKQQAKAENAVVQIKAMHRGDFDLVKRAMRLRRRRRPPKIMAALEHSWSTQRHVNVGGRENREGGGDSQSNMDDDDRWYSGGLGTSSWETTLWAARFRRDDIILRKVRAPTFTWKLMPLRVKVMTHLAPARRVAAEALILDIVAKRAEPVRRRRAAAARRIRKLKINFPSC